MIARGEVEVVDRDGRMWYTAEGKGQRPPHETYLDLMLVGEHFATDFRTKEGKRECSGARV